MTQQEFTDRTHVRISDAGEWWAIHEWYCSTDLDKDEFCKMWCAINGDRVKQAKREERAKQRRERALAQVFSLLDKLHIAAQRGMVWRLRIDEIATKKQLGALQALGISTHVCDDARLCGNIYENILNSRL